MVVVPCLTEKPHLTDFRWVSHQCIHYEILWFDVFLKEKLDLWLCFAYSSFSTVIFHGFWQECLVETLGSVWVPFPLLGLLELCQLAYLQYWSSPLLDPSKTCPVPVCITLCLSRLCGVGCGDIRRPWSMLWLTPPFVWFALVRGLAWTSWSQSMLCRECLLLSLSCFIRPLALFYFHFLSIWVPASIVALFYQIFNIVLLQLLVCLSANFSFPFFIRSLTLFYFKFLSVFFFISFFFYYFLSLFYTRQRPRVESTCVFNCSLCVVV